MKVLVLGQGGREHVISYVLAKSSLVKEIYVCEGNAGTAAFSINLSNYNPTNGDEIVKVANKYKIDWVVVGPEAPAASGTVDCLQKEGIPVFGPNQKSAQLEISKLFSKAFLKRYSIPTAYAEQFDNYEKFAEYIEKNKGRKLVIKKNGLAAGKGVLESDNQAELLKFGQAILSSDSLLVEEYLSGWELSIFALSDGKHYKLLLPCADHKKAGENDTGPNTGGMGAVCPVFQVGPELAKRIDLEIVQPTFKGMAEEGIFYKGVLYFGLMITNTGPKVLEFNVRFGDPEAQVLLPLINTDFGQILNSIFKQRLAELEIKFKSQAALGVVVAAAGYPGSYEKNLPVNALPEPKEEEALIFHASTRLQEDGKLVTGGGRCFTVVGLGDNLKTAAQKAYQYASLVNFKGSWYRKDIGTKFF